MRLKRHLSLILAAVMAVTLAWPYPVYANEQPPLQPESAEHGRPVELPDEKDGEDEEMPAEPDGTEEEQPEDPEQPGETEQPEGPEEPGETEQPDGPGEGGEGEGTLSKAAVENLRLDYQYDPELEIDKVTIAYTRNADCSYVSIYIDDMLCEEHYAADMYIYDCSDLTDDSYHVVKIIPCDKDGAAGMTSAENFFIQYRPALLEDVDPEYILAGGVLIVGWTGENIAYVDIYWDDVLLAEKEKAENDQKIFEIKLEAKSQHTYRVVPYNRNGVRGEEKTGSYEVDDYVATIDYYDIVYDESAKQIRMTWENGRYTEYVSIYLNDVELAEAYKENSFVLNYFLQPGATYVVTIEPYNDKEESGEEVEEDISYGSFDVPEDLSVSLRSVEAKDSRGYYTGFSKPAVYVKWEAQKEAIYDIYRAKKDKKSAYSWYDTVKSDTDGTYTYIDEKVEMGAYYYKICRKVNKDAYVEQALFSALSGSGGAKVAVPKPDLKAKLSQKGKVVLSMASKKDFVSGYDIYRRSGNESYEKIASSTECEFVDSNVEFGKTYEYKAKAYYFNTATGVRPESGYSEPVKIQNAVGGMQAEAEVFSKDTIKLSWTPAANATEYEIYHKSGAKGDDYELWKVTGRLSVKYKASKGGRHIFVIKAKTAVPGGKAYSAKARASCTIGFSAPAGCRVEASSYKFDQAGNTLTQQAKLSWNTVYGAQGYYVELYDKATKKYNRVAKLKGSGQTSYVVSNAVTAGSKGLQYRISAYNGEEVKKGGTVKVTPKLGTVRKVKAEKSGSRVRISWNKVTGAEYYRVYRSNGRTMHLIGKTQDVSIKDKGLNAEISYRYYVQAVNQTLKLKGASSEPAKYSMANSARVAGLTAENMNAGRVDLEWNDLTDAKSYIIYYCASPRGKYQKLAEVSGQKTSYAHEGLPKGQACYYKVTAIQANSGGSLLESKPALANVTVTR